MSTSSAIKIACPYVGIAYLERIISVSREWQLISDVEEWLSSLRPRERAKTWAFIQVNKFRIRNLKGLHAKTVIGTNQAYIGSANLTNMGIYGRTELGVLINDPASIEQLHVWFSHLWVKSDPLDLSEVQAYVDWQNRVVATTSEGSREIPKIFTNVPKIRAKPALIPNVINVVEPLLSKEEEKIQAAVRSIDKDSNSSFVQQHLMLAEHDNFRNIDFKNSNIQKIQKTDALKTDKEECVEKIEIVNYFVNGHILDTDEYVLNYINRVASTGFTFAQLCQAVPKGYTFRRRKLYLALMVFCATRPCSIFWEDAVNRLVFIKDKFYQSTYEDIKTLIKAYDRFFLILLTTLSFDQQQPLPKLIDLPDIEDLHAGLKRQLLKEMQYVKMFTKAETGWLLNPFFIWLPRLKLLACSYEVWQKKLKELDAHKKQSMVSTVTMPSFVIKKQPMDETIAAETVSINSCMSIVPASGLVALGESRFDNVVHQPNSSIIVRKSYEILFGTFDARRLLPFGELEEIDKTYVALFELIEEGGLLLNYKNIDLLRRELIVRGVSNENLVNRLIDINKVKQIPIHLHQLKRGYGYVAYRTVSRFSLAYVDVLPRMSRIFSQLLSKKEAINFAIAKEQELDQENERHDIEYGKAESVLGGVTKNRVLIANEHSLSWASSYLSKIDAVYVALFDKILEFNNPLPMKDIHALQRVLAMNPLISLPIMRLVVQKHPRRGLPIEIVCHKSGEVYVVKRRSSSKKIEFLLPKSSSMFELCVDIDDTKPKITAADILAVWPQEDKQQSPVKNSIPQSECESVQIKIESEQGCGADEYEVQQAKKNNENKSSQLKISDLINGTVPLSIVSSKREFFLQLLDPAYANLIRILLEYGNPPIGKTRQQVYVQMTKGTEVIPSVIGIAFLLQSPNFPFPIKLHKTGPNDEDYVFQHGELTEHELGMMPLTKAKLHTVNELLIPKKSLK